MKTILLILLEVPPPSVIFLCVIAVILVALGIRWADKQDTKVLEEQCCFIKSFLDGLESAPDGQIRKPQISDFAKGTLECAPDAFHKWASLYPKYAEMLKAICIMAADCRTENTPVVMTSSSENLGSMVVCTSSKKWIGFR